jgi:DNA-binding transcriptional LysR family regulator
MPRLPEFRRQHPEVTVRIIAQDTRVALNAQDVDGAFRFGTGAWNDGRAYRLFGDTVGPVCGAEYAERLDRSAAIIKLLRAYPLIEHDYQDAAQTRWSDYQRLAGLEPAVLPVSVACSSYLDVVYSAMANQGIALGWRRIVSTFLEQGQLISLSPPVATSEAYHLVLSPRPRDPRTLQAFVDWVMGCAQAPGDP